MRQRAWYYSRLVADPKDTNIVYGLNVSFFRSRQDLAAEHQRAAWGDNHDLWVAPNDPLRMVQANDGGANVSTNGGVTWSEQDFATATVLPRSPPRTTSRTRSRAQQDNSTLRGPSRQQGTIAIGDWDDAGGGESGYVTADPRDPDIIYAGSDPGLPHAQGHGHRPRAQHQCVAYNPMGWSSEDIKVKFQWDF